MPFGLHSGCMGFLKGDGGDSTGDRETGEQGDKKRSEEECVRWYVQIKMIQGSSGGG